MKFKYKKKIIFVIATVLLLTVAVGTTLAYIVAQTGSVVNTFNPSRVATAVIENGSTGDEGYKTIEDVTVKSNVQIKNTGDTEAYIRAAVVVTWKSESGKVWAQIPETDTECDHNTDSCTCDYSISFAQNTGWVKGSDGIYYYLSPVIPGGTTNVLISEAKQLVEHVVVDSSGNNVIYNLSIEIVASGIQSTPASTVINTWVPVTALDGSRNLVVNTSTNQ